MFSWVGAIAIVAFLICRLFIKWSFFSGLHKRAATARTFPYTLPLLRSTIPFVFNAPEFYTRACAYAQGQWPLRVSLVNDDIYLVQGSKNISSIFRNSGLIVTGAMAVVLKHCFGMDQKAVDTYAYDTSGCKVQPIPGSKVPWSGRASYYTHKSLVEGLLGDGIAPLTERIEALFFSALKDAVPISSEWTYEWDMTDFFEEHLSSAILQALYGPLLIKQNPDFVRNLWKYDRGIMGLIRRLPSWVVPKTCRRRDELVNSIMRWHQQAIELSECDSRANHGHQRDGFDPYWGTTMMRERYKALLAVDGQDPKSVASTDLAFIWATVTNVVPSTMTLCTHMFQDNSIVEKIRSVSQKCIRPGTGLKFDMNELKADPLLLSMYAETLRFGVQIYIPRCSPHQPLAVGGATIPAGKMVIINTAVAHTDEDVWNTAGGKHPLDTFWPRRFLIDSADSESGPLRKGSVPFTSSSTKEKLDSRGIQSSEGTFSVEGLDGSWIPFGGGQNACPGRVLAKRIMLSATAMMSTMFDVELLDPEAPLKFESPRFGFGVRKPSMEVPFRIRRRI